MEHLMHLIVIIAVGMGFPILLFGGATAAIRLLYGQPITGHAWRSCAGTGLMATGILNLVFSLTTAGALLAIALNWWKPNAPITAVPIIVTTIVMAMNALICAALLWAVCPTPTAPWRDAFARAETAPQGDQTE